MKMILQKDALVLRQVAEEVKITEIKTPKIQKIISEMKEALAGEADGVAIAAPQIGYSLRIFVVSKKVLNLKLAQPNSKKSDKTKINESQKKESLSDLVFINPKLIKISKEKITLEEGCLSVRWLYGEVKRAVKATVFAYDEYARPFSRGAAGLMAQIFQHEVDHLNGILFTDKANNLREIKPENKDKAST
jgi:peptide deformylase